MKGMFISLAVGIMSLSANGYSLSIGETRSFMPENDLHLEDTMLYSNVSEQMFNLIIQTGYQLYEPFAKENRETLKINNKWADSTVNANVSRFFGTVTINMYGGLARRPEVSPPAFALVLCHELGHAYGGKPYLNSSSKLSAEGQADYYGANVCLKEVIKVLAKAFPAAEVSEFIAEVCESDEVCMTGLYAGEGLGDLLAVLKKESRPNYETPDPKVVKKTLTSYPETTQCRLDTYFAGTMDLSRPLCWFFN